MRKGLLSTLWGHIFNEKFRPSSAAIRDLALPAEWSPRSASLSGTAEKVRNTPAPKPPTPGRPPKAADVTSLVPPVEREGRKAKPKKAPKEPKAPKASPVKSQKATSGSGKAFPVETLQMLDTFHRTHAAHRQPTDTEDWTTTRKIEGSLRDAGTVRFMSIASEKNSGLKETHHVAAHDDGTFTHSYSVDHPDAPKPHSQVTRVSHHDALKQTLHSFLTL